MPWRQSAVPVRNRRQPRFEHPRGARTADRPSGRRRSEEGSRRHTMQDLGPVECATGDFGSARGFRTSVWDSHGESWRARLVARGGNPSEISTVVRAPLFFGKAEDRDARLDEALRSRGRRAGRPLERTWLWHGGHEGALEKPEEVMLAGPRMRATRAGQRRIRFRLDRYLARCGRADVWDPAPGPEPVVSGADPHEEVPRDEKGGSASALRPESECVAGRVDRNPRGRRDGVTRGPSHSESEVLRYRRFGGFGPKVATGIRARGVSAPTGSQRSHEEGRVFRHET